MEQNKTFNFIVIAWVVAMFMKLTGRVKDDIKVKDMRIGDEEEIGDQTIKREELTKEEREADIK